MCEKLIATRTANTVFSATSLPLSPFVLLWVSILLRVSIGPLTGIDRSWLPLPSLGVYSNSLGSKIIGIATYSGNGSFRLK